MWTVYCKKWELISLWVKNLEEDGFLVEEVKKAFGDSQVEYQLPMLLSLEGVLPLQVKMQQHGITLAEQFQLLDDIKKLFLAQMQRTNFWKFCGKMNNWTISAKTVKICLMHQQLVAKLRDCSV